MKSEEAKAIVREMNEKHIIDKINEVVATELGIKVLFTISVIGKEYDAYIEIRDEEQEANNQMTGTPLLRHLFSHFTLYGMVWILPNGEYAIRIICGYHHPGGGSNGHELCFFSLDNEGNLNYIQNNC